MRSLALKLTLAFLLVGLVVIVLVGVLIWRSSSTAFDRYLWEQSREVFIANATAYYQAHGSWAGAQEYFRRLDEERRQQDGGDPVAPAPVPPFALVDTAGNVLVPSPPLNPGDRASGAQVDQGISIQVDGRVVGVVVATGQPPDRDTRQLRYQASVNQAMLFAALGGVAVALVLAALLARTLTRPLRELTAATRSLARGRLEQQVPVRSRDELGMLATSFNQMSADLAHSNELRRQMTADIAHDLRTPLTVLVGYLESLRDGVLPPTAARFETMYNEALQLQRLVEDLRTLSLADAGELSLNLQSVPPQELIARTVEAFEHRAAATGVALQLQVEPALPAVQVDVERMAQVLGNLVSNALRHTPGGGTITLSARRQAGSVLLAVQDTGEGIAPEVLPHIFDRFYRGESSRQAQQGESGLGLAIVKSIVELHGGTVTAESVSGQGATFTVELPVPVKDGR